MRVIDTRDILHPDSKLRKELGLPAVESEDCFKFLMDLTAKFTQASIGVDEVMLTQLINRDKLHHDDFRGNLWIAVSSVDKYDFRNMNSILDLEKIPAAERQAFEILHLQKNMRNGSQIFDMSFELHNQMIELAVKAREIGQTQDQLIKEEEGEKAGEKGEGDKREDEEEGEEGEDLEEEEEGEEGEEGEEDEEAEEEEEEEGEEGKEDKSKKTREGEDEDPEEKEDRGEKEKVNLKRLPSIEGIFKARCVEGAENAIFTAPSKDVTVNTALRGQTPIVVKGSEAELFMRNTLYKRIFEQKESIVLLGNEDADIDWILKTLPRQNEEKGYLTVYNPRIENEVEESEQRLRKYLKKGRGALVTRGDLFNGMESATVAFIFDNPHASHFRANFLRASVEIFAVDRNNLEQSTLSHGDLEQTKTGATLNENKVAMVARQILSSERVYVGILKLISVTFKEFLEKKKVEVRKEIIPSEKLKEILSNIPTILVFNQGLLQDFEERIGNWEEHRQIADILVKKGPFLQIYAQYLNDFDTTSKVFADCCKQYPQFGKAVKEFENLPECGNLKLSMHMLKPVQRLPQYRLLLNDYVKHQEESSPDFKSTHQALKIVSEATQKANSQLKLGEQFQKMLKLQSRIVDFELIQAGRELVKEGEMKKISRDEVVPRYFVLLNDCFLYTHYAVNLDKKSFITLPHFREEAKENQLG